MIQAELTLPASTDDKDITEILNILNKLGIKHNIQDTIWYERSILIELKPTEANTAFLAGVVVGKKINSKGKLKLL